MGSCRKTRRIDSKALRARLPLAVALLCIPVTAAAQAARGRVLDDSTGASIGQVELRLLDAGGAVRQLAVSADDGTFTIAAPDTGEYRLRANRLGYDSVTTKTFRIGRDTVGVLIRMAVGAVPLAPLTVVAQRKHGWLRGRDQFAEDEAFGRGVLISPQQVAAMGRLRWSSDIVNGVPGVRIVHEGQVPVPESKAWGCMKIVVDNLGSLGPGAAADRVLPQDVVAVEVYRDATEIPPRLLHWVPLEGYAWKDMCGLIVYWTKGNW
jgi:Carboxypeptidase regulatory-like domain